MKVCSVCQRCFEDSVLSCSEDNHDLLSEAREGSCEIIPNYRLEFLHESAPTGETYRALHTTLQKTHLIKIIPSAVFDEESKKRFLSEAQSLAVIYHSNLARVFEAGTLADGSLYVVTEYFEAQTLRDYFLSAGNITEATTVTIARQAAEGLEALHAAGATHRNLKPENIILTSDAEHKFLVKLQNIDFGAIRERQIRAAGDLYLTDARYFSPEQCAGDEADAQADVYALGVVLYEALAGRVPFDAPYADAIFAKHLKEPPPEIKINSFDLRMLLTHTLSDALQKQTRTRLKSANAFSRRLRHIEQLATHSSTPPPAVAYPAAMNRAAVVFTPPVKPEKTPPAAPVALNSAPVESPGISEMEPVIEDLPLETAPSPEAAPPAELQPESEDSPAIEVKAAENLLALEESEPRVEPVAEIESEPAGRIPSFVENELLDDPPASFESGAAGEDSDFEARETACDAIFAHEDQALDEDSREPDIQAAEEPATVEETAPEETAAEEKISAEPVFIDYSTTKLPPIDSIVETVAPEAAIVRTLEGENAALHETSEPVLIDWEQPDDVPTVTAALSVRKKEFADTEFAAPEKAPENASPDADDEVGYVSESYKTRRDYAAVKPVFSAYEDAGRAWNLPGKRAILTGASILGLLVVAIGGVYLNRQIQSARFADQTSAKTMQADKPAKPVEPDKIADVDKPAAVRPEPAAAINPLTTTGTADTADLPGYSPREATEARTTAPAASVKKRAPLKSAENTKAPASRETTEKQVFDKKGNVRPATDKSPANAQKSNAEKSDVFTRPRIVKNPNF